MSVSVIGAGAAPRHSGPIRGGAAVIAAAAAVVVIDAGGTDDGPGLCPVRRCTGGYCPGCGVTRALRHLVHGDVAAAWHDHPWLVLAGVQLLVGLIVAVVAAAVVGGAAVRRRASHIARPTFLVPLVAVNAFVLVGAWVLRIATGAIPAPL